jgi:hypothetical protein
MKFGMVDFGTIIPASLMTTHIKGLQQNEGKTEIEMFHCDRKWNCQGHSEESVAACALVFLILTTSHKFASWKA